LRHARPEDLERIEALLGQIRLRNGLKEKKRGIFYRASRAYLHFHEDRSALFADLRQSDGNFARFEVTSASGRAELLARLDEQLAT
jgi:hypothetical protein